MKVRRIAPILMAALTISAQTVPSTVEGIVVDMATNTPLSNATIELSSPGDASQRYPAVTSLNGQFVVRGAQPGRYSLTVSRSGYLRAQYGQRGPNGVASILTIIAGQRSTGIRLSMMRGSSISGRVYDQDGAPAVNAQIHAWKISYSTGWRLAIPVVSQLTNDLGEYRLFGLPPGLYYVSAQPEPAVHIRSPSYASMAPLAPGAVVTSVSGGMFSALPDPAFARPGGRAEWAPVYFGNTTDEYAATPIRVQPGTELSGTDILIKRTQTITVTGVVIGRNGQPATGPISVIATPSANLRFHATSSITVLGGVLSVAAAMPVRINSMGRFAMPSMSAGSYTFTAFLAGPNGTTLTGEAAALVLGTPTEVSITLSPTLNIEGRLITEGAAAGVAPDLSTMRIRAVSTITALADGAVVTPSASGAFTLSGVGRGNYALRVAPISPLNGVAPSPEVSAAWKNAYVKSARLGSVDVLSDGFRIENPSDARLEVVIGLDGGTVTGIARDNNRTPLANVTVALVPNDPQRQRFDLYRSTSTDENGKYQLNAIPPGSYKVFAWEDIEPQSWYDNALMRTYEDLGKAVTIAEGSTQSIEINAASPFER